MTAVIELAGVSKTYPGSPPVEAVMDVDLTISTGEFVAVMGPSGSGKSTLLNLMGLLDRPTSGELFVDGRPIAELSEHDRTRLRGRAIGFVFQSFELLQHRSVLDNVMLAGLYGGASARARRAAAMQSLGDVGLSDRADSFPHQLSGGERQRVAIARALAGEPRMLLCDEPTGNLDSRNSAHIGELLVELNRRGATVVLITHDPVTAALAQRTVHLEDGRIAS